MRDALRAGAVGVGEVGDGELAFFGVAGVGVGAEFFLPVPHVVAQRGLHAKLVVQANFCNAVDVAQRFLQLEVGVVVHPALKGADDVLFGQPGVARAPYGHHKGETKLGTVAGIELLDVRQLFGGALCQPGLLLLVGGLGRQRVADHGFARQFGVRTHQAKLRFTRRVLHHLHQRGLEFCK